MTNWFICYGIEQVFGTLTLKWQDNRKGNFVAHRYRYSPRISMFIVECDAPTYAEAGFQTMSERECQAYCQQLFSADLGGKALISNHSTWCQFPVARVANWIDGNRVLIGDALRSVHFSVVSGTRLVRKDAIALWRKFTAFPNDIPEGLKMFETSRGPIVEKLLAAAEGSYAWYKDIAKHMRLEPLDLAYDYMTRSGRVDDVRLRRIAPRFMANYDQSKGAIPSWTHRTRILQCTICFRALGSSKDRLSSPRRLGA